MTQEQDPAAAFQIDGREVPSGDPRIGNIQALIGMKSADIDDYRPLLHAAVSCGEFEALGGILLEIELAQATVDDARSVRLSEEVMLCQDDVKTIIMSEIRLLSAGVKNAAIGSTAVGRKPTVDLLANDVLYLVLGTGSIEFDRYRVDQPPDAAAGVAPSIRRVGREIYRAGDIFSTRRDVELLDVDAVEGSVWLLQLVINDHSPLVQHFDRDTLGLVGVSSANVHATRLEFVCDLFKHLGYRPAVAAMEEIQRNSRFHFVRWKAAQTIIHLDRSRARAALEVASEDNHVHVQNAAKRTLASLLQHGII